MPGSKEISKEEIIEILDLKLKSKNPKNILMILKMYLRSVYKIFHSGVKWSNKKWPN